MPTIYTRYFHFGRRQARPRHLLFLITLLALAAALIGPGLKLARTAHALVAQRYIAPSGTNAGDCSNSGSPCATLAYAVSQSATGDTINAAAGTYTIASTITQSVPNLTIKGAGSASTIFQVAGSVGYAMIITGAGTTLQDMQVLKTDLPPTSPTLQNLIQILANNVTIKNNIIQGQDPGSPWSVNGWVFRGLEVTGGLTGLLIDNNVFKYLRQPAYINPGTVGTVSNNNVSGTRGWVIDGAKITFTGNTWGPPPNQGADIALLASVNPADYPDLVALSNANNNAFISAQFNSAPAAPFNGRATAYVSASAAAGGDGSSGLPYQTIAAGIGGVLYGGTVNVGPGTYVEDININRTMIVCGAGPASTTISGPVGGPTSTVAISANNVEFKNFKVTRQGNTVAQWNDPNLNSAGLSVQGTGITGANIHDNLFTQNRTAIDINNSNGHSIHNNVLTDNRTGLIFRNQTDNLTVVENEITNNWTVGVLFLDASGGINSPVQTALNSTFFNNNISANWYGQIVDRQTGGSLPAPGTTNLKNFSANWFGTNTPVVTTANSAEPGYAAQIPFTVPGGTATPPGGQPDIAGPASANFDITPLLDVGTDTNVETTPGRGTYGFQGSFSVLDVTAALAQTGVTARIQEGINLVNTGGTVKVLAGTYLGSANVNKAATLAGSFTITGALTASATGANISPGFGPGLINSGSYTMAAGSALNVEIASAAGPGTGHDQVNVTGTVNLGNATLNLTTSFAAPVGSTFTIVNNDGSDPVTGTFNGLTEGALIASGGVAFRISYLGGTGNDVVLTVVDNQPPTITCPANIVVGIASGAGTVVNYPAPVVTDNVPGATVTCTPPSGSTFAVGTTTVNCTATDIALNTAACSFQVTVNRVSYAISDPVVCTGPGNTVSGSFTITNNGVAATAVTASVALPAGMVGVPGSGTASVGSAPTINGTSVTYSNPALAPGATVTVTYQAQVGDVPPGTTLTTNLVISFGGGPTLTVPARVTVNCQAVGPGQLYPAGAEVSDQKAGSVLVYNYYTSDTASPATNTRISITNTNTNLPIAVHLFFVDGSTCSIADAFLCLTQNQTVSLLASDYDPGTSGYVVAVASDVVTGCPVNFNFLIGDEFMKSGGFAANLGAEAVAALAGGLPACDGTVTTATLTFDGVSYNRLPRVLAADNLADNASGNSTQLVINRIGGDLATGATKLGTLFGLLYDDIEQSYSFQLPGGVCQLRGTVSGTFPRTVPRIDQIIPAGRSGWLKVYDNSSANAAILGAQLVNNANLGATANAFRGGHNLHKLTFAPTTSLTIPVFAPNCRL